MGAFEIVLLSTDALAQLLELRRALGGSTDGLGKHSAERCPTAGTVEMWVPFDDGTERHVVGRCGELTERGVGVWCNELIEVGTTMPFAIFDEADASFHGTGTVRHCSHHGTQYLVGLEFRFERRSLVGLRADRPAQQLTRPAIEWLRGKALIPLPYGLERCWWRAQSTPRAAAPHGGG